MVSMKDIARRCGVSVATVSKALNGLPDVGEETGTAPQDRIMVEGKLVIGKTVKDIR